MRVQRCPRCGALEGHLPLCPDFVAPADPSQPMWAVPVVMALMAALAFSPLVFAQRLFVGMWLHELGHAMTAWLTGSPAVPLPWVTYGPETRSPAFIALMALALVALALRRPALRWLAVGVGALLVIGCLVPERPKLALRVFMGDGGALVLGALLVSGFLLPGSSRLARGGLRWGYLLLGAAGFWSTWATWLSARTDPEVIPYGRNEGVGLSDPSRLTELYGWSEHRLITSYLWLGALCLLGVAAGWVLHVRRRGWATTR